MCGFWDQGIMTYWTPGQAVRKRQARVMRPPSRWLRVASHQLRPRASRAAPTLSEAGFSTLPAQTSAKVSAPHVRELGTAGVGPRS